MKKKILIIEDDPVMGFVCKRLLEKNGYETELVSDGASGVERVPIFQPDAVLLDIMMPRFNGIDVLECLRAEESSLRLPIVVLTNAAVPALIKQAANAGATCILDKSKFNPITITELFRALVHPEAGSTTIGVMSHSEPWKA